MFCTKKLIALFVLITVLSYATLYIYLQKEKQMTGRFLSLPRGHTEVSGKVNMRRPNRGIATYGKTFVKEFNDLTLRKAKAQDAELIQLVRDVIDPPAAEETIKMSFYTIVKTPLAAEVEQLLEHKVC